MNGLSARVQQMICCMLNSSGRHAAGFAVCCAHFSSLTGVLLYYWSKELLSDALRDMKKVLPGAPPGRICCCSCCWGVGSGHLLLVLCY